MTAGSMGGGPAPRVAALAALLLMAASAAAGQEARPAPEDELARGRAIAEVHCSRCHAIANEGASPMEGAPPLRDLQRRYPVDSLAEALAEGIVTGHPSMPEFQLDPGQVRDVIAYLKSLEP